jgi:glycosyltransferase involved in cell wall biosynthesis
MHVMIVGDLRYLHVRRWASGLAGMGVRVAVFSPDVRQVHGTQVYSGVVPSLRPWRPLRWVDRWRANFRKTLRIAKPDLIHVHFPGAFSVPLEDLPGLPLVVSTWGAEIIPLSPENDSERRVKIALLQRADRVVALSRFLAQATTEYASLDPARVQTIYWGVDLAQFVPSTQPTTGSVIGFAKALLPKYGPEYLIEALPRVLGKVPSARVMMLGSGREESSLRAQANSLAVADAITWHGYIDHQQMPAYFRQMAVTIVPSVHESETLAVSALESQAMKVPVVGSRIGGLPESVLDGQTGLLVPPRDPQALADAIVRLLNHHDLRKNFGQQGRQHIERRFDWLHSLESMVALYQELLQAKPDQRALPQKRVGRATSQRR